MIWRILIVIYLWAFASLGLSIWCAVLAHRLPCPRWVRWVGGASALAALLLMSLALMAGERFSLGYLVPMTAIGLGVWSAWRGHQNRCPRYWLP